MTRERAGERGVVLPLIALSMFALLMIVALVVDLGATRTVRRAARSAADSGSTAGALALVAGAATLPACQGAFAYTFQNLGGTQPTSSAITTACVPLSGACTSGSARSASLTVDATTVSVTNPVLDGSSLMRAVAVGGGAAQSVNPTVDGTDCQRVGITVTQPRSRFFGGIAGGSAGTFVIHSVARRSPPSREGEVAPALVTLHQTMRCSIDSGSGKIVLKAAGEFPGVAYSDSDGTMVNSSALGCSNPNPWILVSRSSGRLIAESIGTVPGQLGWFSASPLVGYNTGGSVSLLGTETTATANYTGTLFARTTRITRKPADLAFNCSGLVPADPECDGTNFVADSENLAKVTAVRPAAYSLYLGPCDTTAAPITLTAGDWWVDCPLGFTVKDNPLVIAGGGNVVFRGPLAVDAGGTLAVNVANPLSPTLDASGYPVPAVPSRQTTLIIGATTGGSFSMQSTSSKAYLPQTAIYSKGGGTISGSPVLRWTAPSDGSAKDLMWWSESTQPWLLSGGPTIAAKGILFHGNGPLTISGGGLIDLTKVQVWARSANISGGGTLRLAPDPDASLKVDGGGTALVR